MSETVTPPRHVCFLVDDLEASMSAFSEITGNPFGSIRELPMRMVGNDQDLVEVVRFVYSLDGTIELVAGASQGIFGPDVPRGLHHIGHVLDVGLDVAITRQQSLGGCLEWSVSLGDWMLAGFIAPTTDRPVRVELVAPDVAARAGAL